MFFRKLWLLPLLMLVVEMVWAADQSAVSVDREQVVKQRAAGRWEALIKRDYAAAYAFELPVYRSAYSLEQYQSEFGDDIAWEKVEIGQLLFEGDDVATVYLRMWYRPASHVVEQMPLVSASMTEKWIQLDGQWWHAIRPPWLSPLGKLK